MLISQVDAQASIWYKTDRNIALLHYLHLKKTRPTTFITMVMKTFEMYAKLHDSQRRFNRACDQILLLNTQTSWPTKTIQLSKDQRLQDFPVSTTNAHDGGRLGLVKTYYHYADMKRTEILECRAELTKIDNSENEDEVLMDDDM